MKKLFMPIMAFLIFAAAGCQTTDSMSQPMSGSMSGSNSGTMSSGKMSGDMSDSMHMSYIDITPQKANDLINMTGDLVIIDVSPYYAKGHLPGAVSYPVGDGSLDKAIPHLDKNKTYLVYCHADGPAIAGAKKLVDAGFKSVYRLIGNYGGWIAAGYPIAM